MTNEEIYRLAREYRACNDEIVRLEEDIRLAYANIKRLQKRVDDINEGADIERIQTYWADEYYVDPQPRPVLEDPS
tara:strand:+ start:612 stop:839 length:228 start_codon:yes stop_codon:yes gene_type:complete